MPGKPRLRQRQRVDHARGRQDGQAEAAEFGIEEAEVEWRVVRDQLGLAEERQHVVDDVGEARLAGQMLASVKP